MNTKPLQVNPQKSGFEAMGVNFAYRGAMADLDAPVEVRRCRLTSGWPWVESTWFQPVVSTSLSKVWLQMPTCTPTSRRAPSSSTTCRWWSTPGPKSASWASQGRASRRCASSWQGGACSRPWIESKHHPPGFHQGLIMLKGGYRGIRGFDGTRCSTGRGKLGMIVYLYISRCTGTTRFSVTGPMMTSSPTEPKYTSNSELFQLEPLFVCLSFNAVPKGGGGGVWGK